MEEEIGEVTTAEYGGAAPLHNSTLMAKKAWFMLDNELVALGTDVNANDGFEVQTIVENRRLNKKITPEHTAEAAPDTTEYTVVSISSSGDDGNVAENTMDGDYDTRWSCEGAASITFGLEDLLPIGYVGIAQYNSDGTAGKNAIFELEVSDDGVNWTTVWEGQSSGAATQAMEAYDMKGVTAKYVRYMGHGRVTSQWNSITEFKIYPPTADGSMPVDGPVDTAGDNIFGGELITVDGQAMEVANTWTQSFTDPKWMHIENVAGYYFPNGGSLTLDKVLNGTTPYLEAWFSHGVSPKGGTYAYAMLPAMTAEETAAYSADPDFEILSNTASLQAIKEKKLNTVGAVFWEPGSVSGITASVPMIVMDRTTDGVREICISDPTQKLPEGTVTVSGTYSVVECDDRLTVTSANGSTTITANFNESKGRSLVVKLK